jgi:V-type H+-transporting ATPase subunit A
VRAGAALFGLSIPEYNGVCLCVPVPPAAAVEKTASGNSEGAKITFNVIKQRMGDVLYKLTSQKFEDPGEGEETVRRKLRAVYEELTERFRQLEEEFR